MAKKVDELVVEVKGDTSDISKKLDDLGRTLDAKTKSMGGAFEHLNNKLGKVVTSFGAFGLAIEGVKKAFGPLVSIVEKLNASSGIALTAKRVRVNVETFQELAFAARKVGVDSEGLADAIKDLSVKVTDTAKHGGLLTDALKGIGLEAKEIYQLSPDELFLKFADAVSKAGDEAADLALDEINDQMYRLAPIMREGAQGFRESAIEARNLGKVLTESGLSDMTEAAKSVKLVSEAWGGVYDQILLIVDGPLMKMAESVTLILSGLQKSIKLSQESGLSQSIMSSQKKGPVASGGVMTSDVEALPTGSDFFKNLEKQQNQASSIFNPVADTSSTTSESTPKALGMSDLATPESLKAAEELKTTLILEALQERSLQIAELQEAEILSKQLAEELKTNIELEAIRDRVLAEKQAEKQKKEMREKSVQGYHTALKMMSSLMNTESRKMFEIGKAAAIADTVINTYKSVQKAMAEIPYPANFAVSAAALLQGLNNVNNIRNTQFGSAGGGAASTGGAPISTDAQEVTQTTNIDVTLQSDGVYSGDQVRGLIGLINENTEDNVKLNAVTAI